MQAIIMKVIISINQVIYNNSKQPRRSCHLLKSPVITGLFRYSGFLFIVCVLGEFCYYCS